MMNKAKSKRFPKSVGVSRSDSQLKGVGVASSSRVPASDSQIEGVGVSRADRQI